MFIYQEGHVSGCLLNLYGTCIIKQWFTRKNHWRAQCKTVPAERLWEQATSGRGVLATYKQIMEIRCTGEVCTPLLNSRYHRHL
jgi:hypothetical protein